VNRQLAELARLYGIQTSYRDTQKQRQEATPETLLLTLAALGAPVRSMDDVPRALADRAAEAASTRIPPVIVAWDGKVPAAARRLGSKQKPVLITEDGEEQPWPPRHLPAGYHTLFVRDGSRNFETLVISAPSRAHFPFSEHVWGVFAPVYALDSARGLGAGDLTDFESFANWVVSLGGRVTATLPLLAGYFETPFDPSPYAPVSRLFWNELYADPERVAEFKSADDSSPVSESTKPNGIVDYRELMPRRRAVLERLAKQFFANGSGQRRDAFEAFRRANPGLDDYARFRAVVDRTRSGWTTWSAPLRDGVIAPGDYDPSAFAYHQYAQWIVQEQLQRIADRFGAAGGALYLDMPLGLHPGGFDAWRYPNLFVKAVAAGAPPDPVSTEGQHWGFRPLHPWAMREDRYRYAIAGIRNHLKYAKLLRIDHVMGLHRLYWIPDGVDKSEGVYVEYPADEMYAILSLESHRNRAGIVGEDLGTVPPVVRSTMRQRHLYRLYALQYEIVGSRNDPGLRRPPEEAVACLNTHDMPPFRAFLDGRDIPDRIRLGFLDEDAARQERIHRSGQRRALARFLHAHGLVAGKQPSSLDLFQACVEFIGASRARVALVNVEDLWQETDPQNVPATEIERPNWRRRLKRMLEEIRSNPQFAEALGKLDHARGRHKRKLSAQPRGT
jgi:4-alpha-glucanotransferase